MDKRTASALGTLAGMLVVALVWWSLGSGVDGGGSTTASPSASASTQFTRTSEDAILERELPEEAQQTLALIDAGGPFPYPDHDGTVFRNDEGLLPEEPSGYYHEYTVPKPGEDDRGPWRIITSRDGGFYWTPDHYETFYAIERS